MRWGRVDLSLVRSESFVPLDSFEHKNGARRFLKVPHKNVLSLNSRMLYLIMDCRYTNQVYYGHLQGETILIVSARASDMASGKLRGSASIAGLNPSLAQGVVGHHLKMNT